MTKIKKFEDIDAWKKAREFTKQIYKLSSSGSFAKDFGLKEQIRRAAVSTIREICSIPILPFDGGGKGWG